MTLGVFGAGLGSLPASAAPPVGVLDQTTVPDTAGYLGFAAGYTAAQVFTAGKTGVLTGIDIDPYVNPGAGVLDNAAMTMSVVTVGSDGLPTSMVLARGQFAATTTPGFVTTTLDSTVSVVAGHQYAFTLAATGIAALASSSYSGGTYLSQGIVRNFQLAFQTYVDTSRVAPTISGSASSAAIVGKPYSASYTASGTPTPSISYTGTLPPGLQMTNGVISGSPKATGAYTFVPQASNSVATTTGDSVTIVVRAAEVPGAPTGVTAAAGADAATVSWAAPSSTGDDPIQHYTATSSPDGITCTTAVTNCIVTGLTPGTSYTFTVVAASVDGDGPVSAPSDPVIPYGVPGVPTGLQTVAGNGDVTLTWTAPGDGGAPITGYAVQELAGGTWQTLTPAQGIPTTSYVVPDLVNGTSYTFRVAAINAAGTGGWSTSGPTTPYTVAGVPTDLIAMSGNALVTLSWQAPESNGGSAVTGYTVQYRATGTMPWNTIASMSTVDTVAGLSNGMSYDFRVAANNGAGVGTFTDSVPATPATVPTVPTAVAGTVGDGNILVTWSAPQSTGGADITEYHVRYAPTGTTDWAEINEGAQSLVDIADLRNGNKYDIEIAAINSVGAGPWSAAITLAPRTVPDAPTLLTATSTDRIVDLSWTAPVDDGGDQVSGYDVFYRPTGTITWIDSGTVPGTAAEIPGLDNGTSYDFAVAAINAAGTGPKSGTVPGTPHTTPDAPSITTVTPADRSVTLSWAAPADGGSAITGYTVQTSLDGQVWTDAASTTAADPDPLTTTVTGLTNGVPIQLRVLAANLAGSSVPGDAVPATPRTTAGAPAWNPPAPGDRTVGLSWTAPASDGGAEITGWVIQQEIGGGTWTTAVGTTTGATSATVSGLDDGVLYGFRIAAVNAAGTGDWSAIASAMPRTVPDAPTGVVTTPTDRAIGLSWAAPANDGGSPISGYDVFYRPTGTATWTEAGDVTTVIGLDNGTSYDFAVAAVNDAGAGAKSDAVPATPRTTAGAPTGLTATPTDRTIDLSWAAPADDGGNDITGYELQISPDEVIWTDVPTTGTDTTTSVTDLDNGTAESFRVRAVNAAGSGAWSEVASATPRTIADAPTDLAATPADGTVALTWIAPGENGGTPVTGYEVQYRLSRGTEWSDAENVTEPGTLIDGLIDGSGYVFRVRAENAAGDGAWTSAVSSMPFAFTVDLTVSGGGSLDGATVVPGAEIRLSTSGLPSNATITVEVHSTPVTLGVVQVGADGKAALTATLPSTLAEGAHTVSVTLTGTGADPVTLSVPFTLRAATAAADGLAFTGAAVPSWQIGAGILALLLGAAGLLADRRRRARR